MLGYSQITLGVGASPPTDCFGSVAHPIILGMPISR